MKDKRLKIGEDEREKEKSGLGFDKRAGKPGKWTKAIAIIGIIFGLIVIGYILNVYLELGSRIGNDGNGGGGGEVRNCIKRLTGGAFGDSPVKPECSDTSETSLPTTVNGQSIGTMTYSQVPCYYSGDPTAYQCP